MEAIAGIVDRVVSRLAGRRAITEQAGLQSRLIGNDPEKGPRRRTETAPAGEADATEPAGDTAAGPVTSGEETYHAAEMTRPAIGIGSPVQTTCTDDGAGKVADDLNRAHAVKHCSAKPATKAEDTS